MLWRTLEIIDRWLERTEDRIRQIHFGGVPYPKLCLYVATMVLLVSPLVLGIVVGLVIKFVAMVAK